MSPFKFQNKKLNCLEILRIINPYDLRLKTDLFKIHSFFVMSMQAWNYTYGEIAILITCPALSL